MLLATMEQLDSSVMALVAKLMVTALQTHAHSKSVHCVITLQTLVFTVTVPNVLQVINVPLVPAMVVPVLLVITLRPPNKELSVITIRVLLIKTV